eukprot:1627563-Pyramimonas_sp.AAC.1
MSNSFFPGSPVSSVATAAPRPGRYFASSRMTSSKRPIFDLWPRAAGWRFRAHHRLLAHGGA